MTAVFPLTQNQLINDDFNGTQSSSPDPASPSATRLPYRRRRRQPSYVLTRLPPTLLPLDCTSALYHNPRKYPFRKIRFKRIDSH